jgi:hypothetical protein
MRRVWRPSRPLRRGFDSLSRHQILTVGMSGSSSSEVADVGRCRPLSAVNGVRNGVSLVGRPERRGGSLGHHP